MESVVSVRNFVVIGCISVIRQYYQYLIIFPQFPFHVEVPHEITIPTCVWVPLAHLTQATKIAIIEFAKPIIRSVVFVWTLTPSVFKDPNLEPRWQQQELPQTQMVRKSYDITIWARGVASNIPQCGNFRNFPPLKIFFVKLIYCMTLQ